MSEQSRPSRRRHSVLFVLSIAILAVSTHFFVGAGTKLGYGSAPISHPVMQTWLVSTIGLAIGIIGMALTWPWGQKTTPAEPPVSASPTAPS